MRAHPPEPGDLIRNDASRAPGRGGERRALAVTVLVIAAAFVIVALIHRLLTSEAGHGPALLIAVAWLTGCAVAASLASAHRVAGLAATAAGLAAVAAGWPWLLERVDLVYLAQHAGTHALLGAMFAATLVDARRGRGEPLITRLARRVHGTLPPELVRYTTRLTLLWTAYFATMTAASLALFATGSREAWSVLANLLTLPLVVTLFVAEYGWRLWRYPGFRHASLLDGVRAFRQ